MGIVPPLRIALLFSLVSCAPGEAGPKRIERRDDPIENAAHPPALAHPVAQSDTTIPSGLRLFCTSLGPKAGAGDEAAGQRVEFTEAAHELISGFDAPLRCVVRTAAEWTALRQHGQLSAPRGPAPDFSREMLLVAAMGPRPDRSYDIAIRSVRAARDTLFVMVAGRQTGGDTGMEETSPVHVVRVRTRSQPVRFLEQ